MKKFKFKFPKINPKVLLWILFFTGLGLFVLKGMVWKESEFVSLEMLNLLVPEKKVEKKVEKRVEKKIQKKEAPQVKSTPKKFSMPFFKPAVKEIPAVKPPKVVVIPKVAEVPRQAPFPQAKMAIILDDWGNSYTLLKYALEIHRPITLAIIPNLPQSRKIAEEAYQNKLGVMLHMPMQPFSQSQSLEPHTILTTTSEKDIIRYMDEALAAIPHVEGMNNHMGSAATSDLRVMKTALGHLKKKGLFFIDSNVVSTSVAPRVAREIGIDFERRDIFIDNEMTSIAIKTRLREAKAIALKRGEVVVIGHDKKMTLSAIRELVPEFEKAGIRFVLVREILDR